MRTSPSGKARNHYCKKQTRAFPHSEMSRSVKTAGDM